MAWDVLVGVGESSTEIIPQICMKPRVREKFSFVIFQRPYCHSERWFLQFIQIITDLTRVQDESKEEETGGH